MGGPGSGGYNRKPDWERALDGGRPRPRRKKLEVQGSPLSPDIKPPKWFSAHAKNYFNELAPQLIELGTLDALSLRLFEVLCASLAQADDMRAILDVEGEVTPKGKLHPLSRPCHKTSMFALKLASEFGMTPRGRQRLGITLETPMKDPMESLFRELEE